jgi:multiple sugar transport system ATP-binding protein
MARIILENVTKRYNGKPALDGVSLEIADGSFTSVFGPPSSGKTVLMRVLLGLEMVDEGRIIIDGKDVTAAPPSERNLAMVFQNLALFPQMNARDNIAFPLRRRAMAENLIGERIERASSVLGIAHILHKKPAALSGGERQRVAIGRALVRDAAAYLMDEPIAALDARLRDAMRVELKRLQRELGHTFVYVTHDHEEAMSVADNMAILEAGQIAQVGLPDSIYTDPASLYVAELVGAPRINVLRGAWKDGAVHGSFGQLPVRVTSSAALPENLSATIRPEAIRIEPANGPNPASHGLACEIQDIERLGAFAIVMLNANGQILRAIARNVDGMHPGIKVSAIVASSDVMLFSDTDGKRLHA